MEPKVDPEATQIARVKRIVEFAKFIVDAWESKEPVPIVIERIGEVTVYIDSVEIRVTPKFRPALTPAKDSVRLGGILDMNRDGNDILE